MGQGQQHGSRSTAWVKVNSLLCCIQFPWYWSWISNDLNMAAKVWYCCIRSILEEQSFSSNMPSFQPSQDLGSILLCFRIRILQGGSKRNGIRTVHVHKKKHLPPANSISTLSCNIHPTCVIWLVSCDIMMLCIESYARHSQSSVRKTDSDRKNRLSTSDCFHVKYRQPRHQRKRKCWSSSWKMGSDRRPWISNELLTTSITLMPIHTWRIGFFWLQIPFFFRMCKNDPKLWLRL